MRAPFPLKLALREARASVRRIGLYMSAIALGVAALVSISSLRANVVRAIADEGRNLLGADVRLRASGPFPPPVRALLDSLEADGVPVAYETRLLSMVRAVSSGRTRLVQVQAVEGAYPFYGGAAAEPPGLWPLDGETRRALAEPPVLYQLGIAAGDTVAVGESRFVVAGTLTEGGLAGGFRDAIAGRLAIPAVLLEETGLIGVGSLLRRRAYLRLPGDGAGERFVEANRAFLREQNVRYDTADEEVRDLTRSISALGRFLGLVGLMAMLLGGLGVASAVNVFIREKLPAVAVLRCLGATQRSVFLAYLLQPALLGLGGAAVGAAAGLALQALLPLAFGKLLPVDIAFRVDWPSVAGGLAAGVWTAVIFALLPLLAVRDVAPLQALRRDVDPRPPRRWGARAAALAALAASILLLGIWQAPTWRSGVAFVLGIGASIALLWGVALVLVRATRWLLPPRAPYVVRQGVSNLFRPRNQTVAVTLALGFGVFLVATIYLVQVNLVDRFRLDGADRPNILFFDIQRDQRDGLAALAAERGATLEQVTPIIPARIAALNGQPVAALLADSTETAPERWALRREYRNTYRDSLTAPESLVAGTWWRTDDAGRLPQISVEEGLAGDLRIGVGDRITWDVQGVAIQTEVASLRRVDWAQFAPNFFVVFEPGALEEAPQTLVALARVPDRARRAALQDAAVQRFPNISVLDLSVLQAMVDDLLSTVTPLIRGLALFALVGGLVVLVGALATSRFQRQREGALLKTLGASRRDIQAVQLTEYLALGALAGLAGTVLAGVAGWLLVTRFFELDFRLPGLALLWSWVAVAALAVTVGFLNSRGILRRTPLAVLRELAE